CRSELSSLRLAGRDAGAPTLRTIMPTPPATITYKVADGCPIHADVYGVASGARRPAVVTIHGGAFITGSRKIISPAVLQRCLDAGFAVVSIDYRLAPETKLPDIITDIEDAFRWLHTHAAMLGIDPDRLGVLGYSAGAYLALMTGIRIDPPPAALVSFYGYGDLAAHWLRQSDPYYRSLPPESREKALAAIGTHPISEPVKGRPSRVRFYTYCREHGSWLEEIAGEGIAHDEAALTILSPQRQLTPAYPPTLLLHGDNDLDVPYTEAQAMADALAQASVTHELITLPGYGHVFDNHVHDPIVVAAFDRMTAFLFHHLCR
ncbi:MAG: alpha/beta hydrolase, partial [Armatimonadota bacterium]